MTNTARIFLVGFPGTGKTAVGRRVARLLGWAFVDADELIVERAGKAVERIFAEEGEAAFRALEREAVAELATRDNTVASLGGGAILDDDSRHLILSSGLVVSVEAYPETIYSRLATATGQGGEAMVRPLLQASDPVARIRELKRERQWAYALAHCVVQTERLSVEQAALEVVRAWRRQGQTLAWEQDAATAGVVTTLEGAYPVFVGWGVLEAQLGERLVAEGVKGRAFIVTDSNVLNPYGRAAQRSLHKAGIEMGLISVQAGEQSKTLPIATTVFDWLAEQRAERRDVIVAVGGGVVGDLAGFVAATYLRGMRVVQVPTSMTAMVDSSIGGKTAVDLASGKNLVGAFHHPLFVLADVAALRTLPQRALLEGWAEALKHGLALQADLVDTYEASAGQLLALDPELTTEVVARNVAAKARIVTQDERETSGLRSLLNYGHTIGHGLEAAAGFDRYLHGECVAIGMAGAARLGRRHGVTPADVVERQEALLRRFGLPSVYEGVEPEAIWDAMTRDKKSVGGSLNWVFLEGVGKAGLYGDVAEDEVREELTALRASSS